MDPLAAIAPNKWIMSYIFSYNCTFWSCSACLQLNHLWTCGRLPESWLFYLLKAECSFCCRAQIQLLLGRGGGCGRRFPGSVILTRAWVDLKIAVDRWRMCWPGTWVWALSRAQGACFKEMTWPEAKKMSVWVACPARWLSHPPRWLEQFQSSDCFCAGKTGEENARLGETLHPGASRLGNLLLEKVGLSETHVIH